MLQHIVGTTGSDGSNRPRLLIEDASPVLQVSDLSCYRRAGFDVTVCSGPDDDADCPLLRGEDCNAVSTADVIVFGPDRADGIGRCVLDAVVRRRPRARLVVTADVTAVDGVRVVRFPASIEAQVEAAQRALRS